MFACGSNFVGGEFACPFVPTNIDDINYVEVKNGWYDDLYLSMNPDYQFNDITELEWDFDTVLYAPFNGDTKAGNVGWTVDNTTHLVLRSRRNGSFAWKTLYVKPVSTLEDFTLTFNDYFAASGEEMEYAVIPVYYGQEGVYATTTATLHFDKMFLIEKDTVYGTFITDAFCDTTRNIPSSNVELLKSELPIFHRQSKANYDTGVCSGEFLPTKKEDECSLIYGVEHDFERVLYQRELMDFICNNIPKLLKLPDGRMWIIQVTPNPTDNAQDYYGNRQISFNWVEIGKVDSEKHRFWFGLSDVTEEWWCQ